MKKIVLLVFALITLAIVLFFFPYRMESRIGLDDINMEGLQGKITFYHTADDNADIFIDDEAAVEKLLDYIGSLRGIRSVGKSGFFPLDDHRYMFYLYDNDGNPLYFLDITGSYIQIVGPGRNSRYRIFPRYLDIQVIDEMTAEYHLVEIPDFMEPIEFEDVSASTDFGTNIGRGVQVLYIDGHTGDDRFIIFNDLRPYEKLDIYESGETLIIYYDESQSESSEVVVKVERLPFYPMENDAKIIFILNGKRSYKTEYIYAKE